MKRTSRRTRPRSYAFSRLLAATIFVPLLSCGGGERVARPVTQIDGNRTAIRLLEDVGRQIQSADTFEAIGVLKKRFKTETEEFRVRWLFGARGEYRFERGNNTVLFDGRYLGGFAQGVESVSYDMDELLSDLDDEDRAELAENTFGRPDRRFGDMIMACGMGDGMTFPTAAARLAGRRWVSVLFGMSGCEIRSDGSDVVLGRPCTRIAVTRRGENSVLCFWVDKSQHVFWKWSYESHSTYSGEEFQEININPKVKAEELRFSEAAIKAFREKEADEERD